MGRDPTQSIMAVDRNVANTGDMTWAHLLTRPQGPTEILAIGRLRCLSASRPVGAYLCPKPPSVYFCILKLSLIE